MQTQRIWEPREQNKLHNSTQAGFSLSADEKLLVMEALDHIHVTKQYKEMGSCTACKKISVKKCSGCSTFYCSSECQTYDWPKHKTYCSKSRDSVSDCNSFGSGRRMRGSSSIKNFADDPFMITDRGSPFTALAYQLSKHGKGFSESRSLSNLKMVNKQHQTPEDRFFGENEELKELKDNKMNNRRRHFSPRTSISSKKSSPEEKKTLANNKKNTRNNQNQFLKNKIPKSIDKIRDATSTPKPKKQMNLKKLEKMEVVATYRESSNRYWVMSLENLKKYEEIQEILNRECKNYEVVAHPEVGLVGGCTFGEEWFRAKVVSLTPGVIVHFIDYGNISTFDVDVLKKLPDNLLSIPDLAFLIEFEDGTPNQYITEDLESLKLKIEETTRTPDGVPRVRILEGVYGTGVVMSPPPPAKRKSINTEKRRSVMDAIVASSNGMVFFAPGNSSVRFASIVPDNNKDANDCIEKVLNIENSNSKAYSAKKDDLVLVTDKEGNDQRGKVLMQLGSTYYVHLIDCGNVISSENVYPLSEDLRNLLELGVKISIEEVYSEEQMEQVETCFFTVTAECTSDGKWPCVLTGTQQQKIARVTLEKPNYGKTEWEPKHAYLKSGSTVEISSVCSEDSLYVRPVDVETEQKFLDMNMEMIQFAPKAKSFEVPPLPGELCCAKFLDDNCFYRAVVKSLVEGKVWVLFVDFGNEQLTDLRDVKPLPDSLRQFPFFAVRVNLKDVTDKPWNNMIKDYIGKLTSDNVELTLTYADILSNGVTLREKVSGLVVNDFIERTKDRASSGRGSSEVSEIFLDDDMTYTRVATGDSCTLAVLYVNKKEFDRGLTFWATNADEENFNHVNVELHSEICKHCETASEPYKPSFRELCLAEFEGSWYRAVCGGNVEETFKIFFMDFGNFCDLKSESIRKMEMEFMKAPALGMNCTLKGHEKLKKNPETREKVFEILLNKINSFIEGVKVVGFDEDTFVLEIPEIDEMVSRC